MRLRTAGLFVALVVGVLAAFPAPAGAEAPPRPTSAQVEAALGDAPPAAAAVYDPQEGRFLWGLRPGTRLPVASLMKMVTAVVVAERIDPGDPVTISARAARTPHDRLRWREGATFDADDVMHGMLMESSNGAAVALAEATAGSVPGFAELANQRLAAWGITRTTLIDPSGLDATGQHATARDLALVAARLLRDPWLSGIVGTRNYSLAWPDGGKATFGNINHYLQRDRSAVGVKNGYTSVSGNTVAAAATRKGRTHIVVALDSPDVYAVAKRLMDLAFELAPGSEDYAASLAASKDAAGLRSSGRGGAPTAAVGSVQAGSAVASVSGKASSGTLKLVLFAIFLPYAGYVVGQRKQQQRAARARARAPRPQPTAQVYEYPLVEWMPSFDEEPAAGWDPLSRAR